MNLIEKIESYRSEAEKALAFAEKYGHHFESEHETYFMPLDVILFPDARFTVRRDFTAKAGEVFGRDGWTRVKSARDENYSWTREIDGLRVTIEYCEEMPTMNGTPVPAKAFPLQITEA